ncbi:uncharacterized protein LACBIDRAFT_304827 [Laccaria bicolor S238N-H82]|uniref:Predicted protein n=1 Tax=Laccaria bicolor (strain S238N-H82 / ATCC MYA-4686) TaxID=486041 RepID=B0DMF6_LACBS|nr:uncharacterized protein LACBIDRAFT_304827 [Laccaria bicolor S238N-H82]EDR04278.1 predicted protein [Laccaria bicolor S238N-H82]|eukprot:XP_001885169.1 predicted protein [Laccaria bicolor S238N-H82]
MHAFVISPDIFTAICFAGCDLIDSAIGPDGKPFKFSDSNWSGALTARGYDAGRYLPAFSC